MANQIKPSVTNPTIATVYQEIEDGRLILQPDFQRKFVWTQEHQESFIETIIKGLPFPEIYVSVGTVDLLKFRTTRKVIDGQQRLTTISNYIEGKFAGPLRTVPTYASLGDEEKKAVLRYQLVIRDLGEIDEETTREIFKRINLTKFKLDDVEIHNAIYDGHFIKAAKSVLDSVDLAQYGVLRESEFSRMADLHFILLVMSTIEHGGYFTRDKEVESKVAGFNESYPNKIEMISKLTAALNTISELELELDSMWFRKSNFFTLVVEITQNIDKLPSDLKQRLNGLEKSVIESRRDSHSHYYEYYSSMYQGTHSRKARVVRAEYFNKAVFDSFS